MLCKSIEEEERAEMKFRFSSLKYAAAAFATVVGAPIGDDHPIDSLPQAQEKVAVVAIQDARNERNERSERLRTAITRSKEKVERFRVC